MNNKFKYIFFTIGMIIAIVLFFIQIRYSQYNNIAYIISTIYLIILLIALLFMLYKKDDVNITPKTFNSIIIVFLVSEIPIIYTYRNKDSLLQRGVTNYILLLTFLIILGSVLISVVKKISRN